MDWKKGIFSYILWAVYTGAVCAGVIAAGLAFSSGAEISAGYGVFAAIIYLLAVGFAVLSVKKLIHIGDFAARMADSVYGVVLESAMVVLLLAVGLYLRLDYLTGITDIVGGSAYFEAARVVAGQNVPQVVHGGTYLYMQLLHGVLLLLGNKAIAALGLQIVLQICTALLLYVAVCKYSGVFAGLTVMAFFMLSDRFVTEVAVLSPAMLILLVYSVVFSILACYMKSRYCNAIVYLLCSGLAGIVVYLDLFGVTLFLLIGGFLFSAREWETDFLKNRVGVAIFSLLGGILGFAGSIAVDAYASGKPFVNVIIAWGKLWIPRFDGIGLPREVLEIAPALLVLVVILTVGLYSFWYRKGRDTQGIWVIMSIVYCAMLVFRMELAEEGFGLFLLLFLAALAGAGLDNLFAADDKESEEMKFVKEKKTLKKEKFDIIQKIAEQEETEKLVREEPADEKNAVEEIADEKSADVGEEAPKIRFLDNPLPLPKKHVPKVLEYRINDLAPDCDYDIEVADDDDFDI